MLAGAGGQHDMARPYSQDLRDRVIGSVVSGRTCRATAALFGVSVASVVKWSQRWRVSGSAAAKPMGGWKQLLLKSERGWEEAPHGAVARRCAALSQFGHHGAQGQIRLLGDPRHQPSAKGSVLKKSLHASEQDRADV